MPVLDVMGSDAASLCHQCRDYIIEGCSQDVRQVATRLKKRSEISAGEAHKQPEALPLQ
jgi:hypothetical protein